MKKLVLAIFLYLCSCASSHSIPDDSNSKHAISYCGGELWGYVLPIGSRKSTGFWNKKFEDQKPLLAVFLHMHSILEKDPEHSLTFHFALRTKEDISIQFPEKEISVLQSGTKEKTFKMDLVINEDALTVEVRT